MAKTKIKKNLYDNVAAWLVDAFGQDGDVQADFNWEAADFIRFMKANGFEFHAIEAEVERPPF